MHATLECDITGVQTKVEPVDTKLCRVCVCARVCVRVRARGCVCVYVCVYIYIYIYIVLNTTILQLVAIYNILHVSALYVGHHQVVQRTY